MCVEISIQTLEYYWIWVCSVGVFFMSGIFFMGPGTHSVLAFSLWKLSGLLFQIYRSPLLSMPGPRSSHFFYGNMKEIIKAARGHSILSPMINCINTTQDIWVLPPEHGVKRSGPTFKYYGFLKCE
jgi:hypothetical protein